MLPAVRLKTNCSYFEFSSIISFRIAKLLRTNCKAPRGSRLTQPTVLPQIRLHMDAIFFIRLPDNLTCRQIIKKVIKITII